MLLFTITTTTLFNRFNNVPLPGPLFENEGGSKGTKFNLSLKKLRAPLGDAFKPTNAGADRRAVRRYPSIRYPHGGG